MRSARPNWWMVVPLVWAVPAIVSALQSLSSALYSMGRIGQRDWIYAATQIPRYILWAPLTPLIVAAVRRFPFQRPGLMRAIAENAIRHGIQTETGAGSIEVTASRAGPSLVIEVRDSGRGPGDDVTERIGLTTARGRLARLYPDAHEFSLGPGSSGGTVARIRIPFRTASG